MSYESGKKLGVIGFILSFLVFIGTYVLNVVLLMTSSEAIMANPYEEVIKINSMVHILRCGGYTLCFLMIAVGFFFMFMEDRDTLLLLTAGSLCIAALPNILGLFGIDISAMGIINNIGLDGVLLAIIYFVIIAVYSLYIALFALQAFKMGNAIFGIILILIFLWNTVGQILMNVVQSIVNSYGSDAVAQYSSVMTIVNIIIALIITAVKTIHVAKNY